MRDTLVCDISLSPCKKGKWVGIHVGASIWMLYFVSTVDSVQCI